MNRRWRTAAWILALLGMLLAWAAPAQGQGSGTLTGRVEDGTAGSTGVLEGLTVTLHSTDGVTEPAPLQTTTDAQGAFRFDGLDTDPSLAYLPEVEYLGVSYGAAQAVSFGEGEMEVEANVTVFETTADGSGLRVESVHLVAESFEQVLRISEVHVLGNAADRAFVGRAEDAAGGQTVTVFVPVPENAVGIAFPEDEPEGRYIEVEGGIWDTQPVPPGAEASVIRFSYHLMVEGSTVALERRFTYPVSVLSILVVQPGLSLQSEQLLAGEPITFQDTQYEVYQAAGLGAGDVLRMQLVPASASGSTGMPAAPAGVEPASQPAAAGQQRVLRWLGLALVLLAAAGALVYPLLTRPRGRS